MQALGIVDIGDEPPEADLSLHERAVLLQIHLLALERLEEALGLGVLGAGTGPPVTFVRCDASTDTRSEASIDRRSG